MSAASVLGALALAFAVAVGTGPALGQGSNSSDKLHGKDRAAAVQATKDGSATTDSAGPSGAAIHQTSGTAATVGAVDQPQPLSNADRNPGGANNGGDCGAYCSTRDGSPSLNGSGTGAATGKPCAGCVGKADNKNPPGQQPDGTDHNAGYECDRNHGIGQTNPAHTGCIAAVAVPVLPPPPGTPRTPQTPGTPSSPPAQPPAQPPTQPPAGPPPTQTSTPPGVLPEQEVNVPVMPGPGAVIPNQLVAAPVRPAAGSPAAPPAPRAPLPMTGTDTLDLLAAAFAAMAVGVACLHLGLQRRAGRVSPASPASRARRPLAVT